MTDNEGLRPVPISDEAAAEMREFYEQIHGPLPPETHEPKGDEPSSAPEQTATPDETPESARIEAQRRQFRVAQYWELPLLWGNDHTQADPTSDHYYPEP